MFFTQVVCDIESNITERHENDTHINDTSIVYEYYDELDYQWDPFKGKTYFYIVFTLLVSFFKCFYCKFIRFYQTIGEQIYN